MFRTALMILSGNAAASLLLLARNLIVARLLPVADYGVAATFAMAMAVVEMASALGLQQQIVQSKQGDDPHFQAVLQGFQLLRGVLSGAVLVAVAGPLARFLGIPEVAWAYQVLALVPVLNAAQHFDIHRLNRQMRFGPLILTGTVPALLALLLVWPLAIWFGDWQVMLWSIIAQAAVAALVSHLVAERPWRLAWDSRIIAGSLRFGWPLLVNAALLFLVFQGDKLIVGHLSGMETLAIFSMGMTLSLTPTLVLAKSIQNLFLPRISRAVGTPGFGTAAVLCLQVMALSSLAFALLTLLFGGLIVDLLLGEKYAELVPLLIWFALSQAMRLMRGGAANVALALAQTTNAMWANIVRVAALPLAWVLLERGGSLLDFLFLCVAAEGLALVAALVILLYRNDLRAGPVFVQQGVVAGLILLIGFWSLHHPPQARLPDWPVWLAGLLGLCASTLLMPELIRQLRSLLHR